MLFSYESFKGMQSWCHFNMAFIIFSNDLNSTKSSFKNSLTQRELDVCRVWTLHFGFIIIIF